MRNFFVIMGLLLAMFVVSACTPQPSDEELNASLAKLSDEELDSLLGEMESKGALAGQAVLSKYDYTIRTVSADKLLISAQREKIDRLQKVIPPSIKSSGTIDSGTSGTSPEEIPPSI